MTLDRETIRRLAEAVRIRIDDAEADALAADLGAVLEWAARLRDVPVVGVEPLLAPAGDAEATRPDRPEPGLPSDAALAGAPDPAEGRFRVPRALESGR